MTMTENNNGNYSRRFCDERHIEINRRVENLEKSIESIKAGFTSSLVMLIINLIGIIAILLQGV